MTLGRHRSRLRILANILSVIGDNHGAKKTQIMYQAYLSYKLLVQYLNDLNKAMLVTCGDENCYVLTQKGKDFLINFKNYDKSCKNVEKELNHVEFQKLTLESMCPTTGSVNVDIKNQKKPLNHNV